MKKSICILICIVICILSINITIAQENEKFEELKILVREGDKALMDSINQNNAQCQQTVEEKYNGFVMDIQERFKAVLFVERVTLAMSFIFGLLFAWGIKGLISIWVKRGQRKSFLLKIRTMEQIIEAIKGDLKKNDVNNGKKRFKRLIKYYTQMNDKGRGYIYPKILEIQNQLFIGGTNGK